MIKFIIYFPLSIVLLVWLSQNNGTMHIDWLGYQVDIELIFLIPVLIIAKIIIFKALLLLIRTTRNRKCAKQIYAIENIINGLSYVKIGDALSANLCINQTNEIFEDEAIMKLLKANSALLQGNVEPSKKYLLEIVETRNILSVTALNQLLSIAYTDGNLLEIESIVNQAAALFPKESWALLKQGEFFCYTKQYEQAVKILEKLKSRKLTLEYNLHDRISILYYALAKEQYLAVEYCATLSYLDNAGNLLGIILLKAKAYHHLNKQSKALHILEKEYKKNQHIDILNLHLELGGNISKLSAEINPNDQNKGWQCVNCYSKFKEWDYICTKCDKLDNIHWI